MEAGYWKYTGIGAEKEYIRIRVLSGDRLDFNDRKIEKEETR